MSAPGPRTILLDTGPLSLLSRRPGHSAEVNRCQSWLATCRQAGASVLVPEIADYDLRRELLRSGRTNSIRRLDALAAGQRYLPITTAATRKAAELWAQGRQQHQQTAPDLALDADVILAAQALTLNAPNLVIATSNPGHIARFTPAEAWEGIAP